MKFFSFMTAIIALTLGLSLGVSLAIEDHNIIAAITALLGLNLMMAFIILFVDGRYP